LSPVVLIGYGGPTRREEVRPFLEGVVAGRRVPPARLDEVEHHYEAVGGRSPYNELTEAQARALARVLGAPVHVGHRQWHPYVADTLARLAAQGERRAVGVIMAPHQCYSSWQQYQEAVEEASRRTGVRVDYTRPVFDHPGFLRAVAARVHQARTGLPPDRPPWLLFTAHSIPVDMAREAPYEEQLRASCRGIAELVGLEWSLAYQSRSGDPRTPWLEPDVNEALKDLAADSVILVPVGFLCDHVEVLFDLDIEALATARRLGISAVRAGTVGDHPEFIAALADRVREVAGV
jgi:ferrochelatase